MVACEQMHFGLKVVYIKKNVKRPIKKHKIFFFFLQIIWVFVNERNKCITVIQQSIIFLHLNLTYIFVEKVRHYPFLQNKILLILLIVMITAKCCRLLAKTKQNLQHKE